MRYILSAILITLLIATVIYAQDSPQWHLPEGAKMRLGKGMANDIAYSPDGTKFAVATGIGIWIYDAYTGEELNLFTGGTGHFETVAFSPDGSKIASDIDGNRLALWDVETGKQLRTYSQHSHFFLTDITFSPDGKMLASAGSGSAARVWDVASGRQLHTIRPFIRWISSVAFSPDSKTLLTAGADGNIKLWDVADGRLIRWFTGQSGGISSIAFHPDGKIFASGSYDNTVRFWDVQTGEQVKRAITRHNDSITAIAFSPDGNTLATGSYDKRIYLWRVSDLHLELTITRHNDRITNLAFSPDSFTLMSMSRDFDIHFTDVFNGWLQLKITGHKDYANRNIVFSLDSNTLFCEGYDGLIYMWDANTGTQLPEHIQLSEDMSYFVFSPDRNTLVSSSGDGMLHIWDADTQRLRHKLITPLVDIQSDEIRRSIGNVVFSADGKTLACLIRYGPVKYSDHFMNSRISVFDVETGTALHTIAAYNAPTPPISRNYRGIHPTEHTEPVRSIAFTPDGTMIVSSSSDRTVRLWDVTTGTHFQVLIPDAGWATDLSFSLDGKILAFVSNSHYIQLWDMQTRTLQHTLSDEKSAILEFAFSPDGTMLATAGDENTIRLWDVQSGTLKQTLIEYTGSHYILFKYFNSVVFSPDGSTLATGNRDGTILLWNTVLPLLTNTTVGLSPMSVVSPVVGQQLTLSLNIGAGQNVSGYQATVNFDATALRFIDSSIGDYLPDTAFVIDPVVETDRVTLGATAFGDEVNYDGILATITFEVIALKPSTVSLSDVLITDSVGNSTKPIINGSTEITTPAFVREDVNQDGVVNILDLTYISANFGRTGKHPADVNGDGVVNIVDLALVAAAIGNNNNGAAPTLLSDLPSREDVESWIHEARQLNLSDPDFQRGMTFLENLLAYLTPKETALLPNYPNPFNPETWIPYQLASPADVRIDIYASDGQLVRKLTIGQQTVGIHQQHWDGNNDQGEKVASGVYFYTLRAGEYTATRKMSIAK